MPDQPYAPLTFFQRHRMVEAALDPETCARHHARYTYNWAVRITPSLSPRKAQRAFRNLTQRHDSLRLRIVEHGGDWVADIPPDHAKGLVVEDHGPLSQAEQEALVARKCATLKTALDPALFEMELLRFGAQGDILLGRAQHAIYDAYSVSIVLAEAISFLLDIPVTGHAASHREFMAHRARLTKQRDAEKTAYWDAAIQPPPPPLRIGRMAKGLPPLDRTNLGPCHRIEAALSIAASDHVKARTKATGLSANAQILTAFGDSVCAMGNGDETIWRGIMGRQEAALSSFVGPAMQGFYIKYKAGAGARVLSDMIARGADMLPAAAVAPGAPNAPVDLPYMINMPKPTGPLDKSPMAHLLTLGDRDGYTLGPLRFERVPTGEPLQIDCELDVNVAATPNAPNVELVADEASWTVDELRQLADRINASILAGHI
ncbi:MAG: condensation domain-containing protein [Pseudomonadota bacterium]